MISKRTYHQPLEEDIQRLHPFILSLSQEKSITFAKIRKRLQEFKEPKYIKNSFLIQVAHHLCHQEKLTEEEERIVVNLLRIKRGKSHSGIISVTIFTSPHPSYTLADGSVKTQPFSCKWNCSFCPTEPGQPKSYLKQEPGVLRANMNQFDPCLQMWSRMESLYNIGHDIDKIECLVLGGTWSSYPIPYREEFIRDSYYAANVFWNWIRNKLTPNGPSIRSVRTLQEEVEENKTSRCRIIGLTLETRPDCINAKEIQRFRSYGCTRVQLGVQHLDDDVLKANNRQCTTDRYIHALRLLKDSCFKVDIHIMPNLYGSTPQKDRTMLLDRLLGQRSPCRVTTDVILPFMDEITTPTKVEWEEYDINSSDLSADQWKLYPCETTAYTDLERWYKEGKYVPYDKKDLLQILYDTKCHMYPWIRVNRIIRDISSGYILASSNRPNTGQVILQMLKQNQVQCMCIRCREVKEKEWDGSYMIVIREYQASKGVEYFISAESSDKNTMYGFCRLRIRPSINKNNVDANASVFPELEGCALVRELHVYSNMSRVRANKTNKTNETNNATSLSIQHCGIGRHLLFTAESITRWKHSDLTKMAVIAGVGACKYYERLGYLLDKGLGSFMIKSLLPL
jgi:histone acetyltransferase (RNA polymerase elongator complex component)